MRLPVLPLGLFPCPLGLGTQWAPLFRRWKDREVGRRRRGPCLGIPCDRLPDTIEEAWLHWPSCLPRTACRGLCRGTSLPPTVEQPLHGCAFPPLCQPPGAVLPEPHNRGCIRRVSELDRDPVHVVGARFRNGACVHPRQYRRVGHGSHIARIVFWCSVGCVERRNEYGITYSSRFPDIRSVIWSGFRKVPGQIGRVPGQFPDTRS